MNQIYLDHNATTPIHPLVIEAMTECYRASYANPASQHCFGRRARKVLEEARDGIAELLGADRSGAMADQLIFTSGGTESNNLALGGCVGEPPGNIVISSIEHPSIVGAANQLVRRGFVLRKAAVSADGVVDIEELRSLIDDDTKLVSIMLGNNETGVLQPIQAIAKVCSEHEIPLHTDAVQVIGKLPVDFRKLGVAALSASAHKFHGPAGIGALVLRHDCQIEPILFGGSQQMGFRPGTETIALAVGMHTALKIWKQEAVERAKRMTELRDRLESAIAAECADLVFVGNKAERLPHTSNISFVGLDRQALLMALDMDGVACSTGSACASGSSEPSPVLLAMKCSKPVVEGSIRVSLGALTTTTEIDEAARRITKVVNNLRRQK